MIRLGLSVHDTILDPSPLRRRRILERIAAAGIGHVAVGDHISFHDGTGFDGLISATTVLATHDELAVHLGVYLLGLRHPMLAARQLSTLAEIAPARLVLGVGVGGEDRSEISNSGVDPATRGRRLDETLALVRALLDGEEVTHRGEFFELDHARILPAPVPSIPIIVGGKGDAAIWRAARYGEGWLGVFCSARRFGATREQIMEAADSLGRKPDWFGINVWCGLDSDSAKADDLLGRKMAALYHLPRERFRNVAPAGTPEQVADWLRPFVAAGAGTLTLNVAAESVEAGIDHAAAVRELLCPADS
ncbi:LLM class flavin-dependent oxidoreductase [Nocardia sp. NPDC004860]|uniref:LLM class flavin-dependent oxidoreductase n=1 Tax=Nocardia sp. NPDC004860 TaxID=3154557 RepID=UPI0033BFB0AA